MGPWPVDVEARVDGYPSSASEAPHSLTNSVLQTRPLECRWHGRGGQGVVTASRLLAEAALLEGLHLQSLPDFGAERSGAPLAVYTRVGTQPFWEKGHVSEPDVVVVLDPSLLGRVNVLSGMRQDGVLVANTRLSPQELRQRLPGPYRLACTIDGTAIAMQLLGRNLPNIPILGALIKAVPVVSLERVKEAVYQRFGLRFPKRVLEANLQALERGYAEVSLGGGSWL